MSEAAWNKKNGLGGHVTYLHLNGAFTFGTSDCFSLAKTN